METALKSPSSKARYLRIKAQLNSDGTATPVLDDFEITYTASATSEIVDIEGDSGSDTLDDTTIGVRITPDTLPCLIGLRLGISDLNNTDDDFTIDVSVGASESERCIEQYTITGDATDAVISACSLSGILHHKAISLNNILIGSGEVCLIELTKNSSTEREVDVAFMILQQALSFRQSYRHRKDRFFQ